MSIASVKQKAKRKTGKISGWDQAILDAKEKIRQLRYSIKVYSEQKKAGHPWPGESATQS